MRQHLGFWFNTVSIPVVSATIDRVERRTKKKLFLVLHLKTIENISAIVSDQIPIIEKREVASCAVS